jgi:hypothetical protein
LTENKKASPGGEAVEQGETDEVFEETLNLSTSSVTSCHLLLKEKA